jgi:adenylate kinase
MIQGNLRVPHISTGELLRRAVAEGTDLGRQAQAFMDRGELVPDELVVGMIRERLASDGDTGFLLDGFPRNVAQAETLEVLLSEQSLPLDYVISLDVPREELVQRLLGRGREDDNEETIRSRLIVYEEETAPLRAFYGERGILREVNGLGSREGIRESILEQLA